ncbi:uncharacterized protein METZ01_LOCUS340498 [marine metagenome]|uniref:Uncharacterized protein n=1 Tax=marine metagenome TaxID=408172 RepID=A0A382QQ66_9ZZZZ
MRVNIYEPRADYSSRHIVHFGGALSWNIPTNGRYPPVMHGNIGRERMRVLRPARIKNAPSFKEQVVFQMRLS